MTRNLTCAVKRDLTDISSPQSAFAENLDDIAAGVAAGAAMGSAETDMRRTAWEAGLLATGGGKGRFPACVKGGEGRFRQSGTLAPHSSRKTKRSELRVAHDSTRSSSGGVLLLPPPFPYFTLVFYVFLQGLIVST